MAIGNSLNDMSILVVDDDPELLYGTTRILKSEGYQVLNASSGSECFRSIQDQNPDLVLLDVVLPDMDGRDICKAVKSDPLLKKTHIILISGLRTSSEEQAEAIEIGADSYLFRPIGNRELKAKVKAVARMIRIEKDLRDKQKWLETTLNSIGDGVIATDDKGKVIFMNPTAENITGWNEKDAFGHPINDIFHIINEITGNVEEDPVARVLKEGIVVGLANHTLLISRDGRKIPIKDSGAPIRLNETELLGAVLVFQDDTKNRKAQTEILDSNNQLKREIKERRYAEQALQENASILSDTQKLSLIGTWEYDPKTDRITWSEQTYANYGIDSSKKLTRKDLYEIIHPAYRGYHKEQETLMLEKGENTFEYPIVTPDGKNRWIFATAKVFYDDEGKQDRIFGLTQNITNRKIAEKEIKRQRDLFELVINSVPTRVFWKDLNLVYLGANIHFAKDSGMERPEDIIGKNDYDLVWKEDADVYRADDKYVISTGKPKLKYEEPFFNKDGEKVIWLTSKMPLKNTDGKTIGVIATSENITELKNAEEQKRRLEEQLQHSQKFESIGNLAGGIAHDFNNILTSIIGFTELALDETSKGTTIEDHLQEVYTAGKRAKELVKQILAFARQSDEKRSPIQPSVIAKEVLQFIRSTIPTTIQIRQEIDSDAFIMANSTQVHQILMNLCTNAAYAMEKKGGILVLRLRNMVIDRQDSSIGMRIGSYVEIAVSDTGDGIPTEIIGSIFDPYFTTKGPGEGTGMGLAMVHGIVESYGGKISVNSQLGKGTTFTIYLPVTRTRKALGEYVPEQLPAGTENILLVDDEATIAKMGSQILERLGYSVSTRTSSIEALELFRGRHGEFDAVITDMTMPNMTGDQLAIEILKIKPDVPVILCTGYSKILSEEVASEIGIKAFAYKPIVRADLAKTVRKVLDEAKFKNQQ